ncbi:MAG: flagellar basal body rod protein FlgC [Deltaproteobacteria bacterium]|nr:flagellar basal body rod protein FlgC [Deltaproteobacteria bacterium]
MSFFKAMDISSSGLAAQRVRMNVLSANLANAQSTRGDDGGPYKRRDVVVSAVPTGTAFEDYLNDTSGHGTELRKVQVVDIHKDTKAPRRVFDPSNPDADATGYVEMPNVQVMSEMVNMIAATRAFEANATALNDAKQMAMKALEIGR